MDNNFGIPQISKYIDNLSLFDGKEEAIQAYAAEVKSGKLDNMAGYDLGSYKNNMAKITVLEK